METLRIFIGWDDREAVAFHVLSHSILERASIPVSITPLVQSTLRSAGLYRRPVTASESTQFAFSRFLTPFLCGYQGIGLFLDCDMVMRADVTELVAYALAEPSKSVFVCPHDYVPRQSTKFLGQPQAAYPRKNWSSLMLFRNDRCRALTPERVNTATGADLHRFAWLPDDQIGHLPLAWNYLVGEDQQSPDPPKVIHFTNGTPCFEAYRDCEHADVWFAARDRMLGVPIEVSA
jgi:lipopolysaccharide biosynthesis glycosyltransferase